MSQLLVKVYFIAVAPPVLHNFQNTRLDQSHDYSLHRALGDAYSNGDFPGCWLRCLRKTDEHMRVVAEKSPTQVVNVDAFHMPRDANQYYDIKYATLMSYVILY